MEGRTWDFMEGLEHQTMTSCDSWSSINNKYYNWMSKEK